MSEESNYEILPAEEMRKKYGLYAENAPRIRLDASKVPEALRSLIPMAERFGVSDDLIRDDVRRNAPPEELEQLRRAVEHRRDALDAWLAGPEAAGPKYSAEYIAFSAMCMAADEC